MKNKRKARQAFILVQPPKRPPYHGTLSDHECPSFIFSFHTLLVRFCLWCFRLSYLHLSRPTSYFSTTGTHLYPSHHAFVGTSPHSHIYISYLLAFYFVSLRIFIITDLSPHFISRSFLPLHFCLLLSHHHLAPHFTLQTCFSPYFITFSHHILGCYDYDPTFTAFY